MTDNKKMDFTLRPISMDDLEGYFKCMSDDETIKGFNSVPETREEAREEIKEHLENISEGITEVLTIEVDGKYAGNIKLDYQDFNKYSKEGRIHIWMHPSFRGKGIATKAMKEVIKYGFEGKGFNTIYAQCKESNKAVCELNKKVGFELVEPRLINGVRKLWWKITKE